MLLPLAVLGIGIAVTGAFVRRANHDIEQDAQAAFVRQAEAVKTEVNRRLQLAVSGLGALRAMHAAIGTLDAGQLRRYVAHRDLEQEFPGLRGFGVIERVDRRDGKRFEQRLARDVPGFRLRTSGSGDPLYVIRGIEPIERNRAALGYDSGSNAAAREALEHAIDTGIATMSAPLHLQQDDDGGLGWVLYMPVYDGEPRSADQRREGLALVVFTPVPARDLLATVSTLAGVDADFRLYDEAAGHQLVFDGAPQAAPGSRESWQAVVAGDRVLALQVVARPDPAGPGGLPWLVAVVGLALAGALSFLTWRQVAGRQRALASEDAMRHDVRAHEHLLRTVTDNLPARISYWDREGRCLLANRRFREVYQVGEDDMRTRTLSNWPGQLPLAGVPLQVEQVLRGIPQHFEQELVGADGRRSTWQVHYMPDLADGVVKGFFVLASDVTELRKARDEAIEASGAKTRFLSSMSHEIRTPMNAILGMLTLLRRSELPSRQDDYAEKAEGAARSLLSLLNDVLDFSKIEAGKMQLDRHPFSLEKMLTDLSVVLSANVGGKDIEVLYDLDPDVPDVLVGDDMRLRQVLINLGGNAVKFTDSGEVVLRTRLVGREGDAATVEFAVTDTGIGISEDAQHGLFDDYAQAADGTARRFGGTGLGLSICRRLAALMGATLQLHSVPGQGSCFSFTLTLPVAAEREAGDGAPASRLQRILVVDDNPMARLTLSGLARTLCWRVDTASSGAEAVALAALAREEGAPHDLVLVDWRMPGLDGWQTSLQIRAAAAGGPAPLIVMVTGQDREMLGARSPDDKALIDAFLVKPVTASALRATLARLLDQPARPAPSPAPTAQPLAGLRLLVAEDNPVNQQIAGELLASLGAQVEIAADGREAVEHLRQGRTCDAVLMDMLMPVLDGLAATAVIRGELGLTRLPIIAMTANAMESDRADCLAAGMVDHLAKPIVLSEVVATLLRHVRGASAAAPADGPGPAAAADAVIDREGAIGRLGGDRALFQRLLPVFQGNLRQSRQALDGSLQGEELCRLMHTLKGTAATMGAAALADAARRAEERLRAGSPEAGACVQEVVEAIDGALGAIAALLAQAG